ncbi:hypothetical protein AAHE18_20G046600 [Arachis hypogaea]
MGLTLVAQLEGSPMAKPLLMSLILYNYGTRKIVLFGVGQIGCSPNELAQNSRDGTTCVERINSANQMFNNGLKSLLINSTTNYPMQDSPTSTLMVCFKIL